MDGLHYPALIVGLAQCLELLCTSQHYSQSIWQSLPTWPTHTTFTHLRPWRGRVCAVSFHDSAAFLIFTSILGNLMATAFPLFTDKVGSGSLNRAITLHWKVRRCIISWRSVGLQHCLGYLRPCLPLFRSSSSLTVLKLEPGPGLHET